MPSASPLAGIDELFWLKNGVMERMAYVKQLAMAAEDPALLKWLRNQVSEPFGIITKRLNEIEAVQARTKDLPNGHSVE